MRILLILIIAIYSQVGFSKTATNTYLNFYLPGYQMRFEDNNDQGRSAQTYSNLSISTVILNQYFIGLESNKFEDQTGNASLLIAQTKQEYSVLLGYNLWNLEFSITPETIGDLNLFALAAFGTQKTKIETNLLGQPQTDESTHSAWGGGALVALRIKYFLLEVESRMMTSKNYEPQTVNVTTFKLGAAIPIN